MWAKNPLVFMFSYIQRIPDTIICKTARVVSYKSDNCHDLSKQLSGRAFDLHSKGPGIDAPYLQVFVNINAVHFALFLRKQANRDLFPVEPSEMKMDV